MTLWKLSRSQYVETSVSVEGFMWVELIYGSQKRCPTISLQKSLEFMNYSLEQVWKAGYPLILWIYI